MKASSSLIWVVALIIGVLSVGTAVNQGWLGSVVGCNDVFCNEYRYACCCSVPEYGTVFSPTYTWGHLIISNEFKCLNNYDKCDLQVKGPVGNIFIDGTASHYCQIGTQRLYLNTGSITEASLQPGQTLNCEYNTDFAWVGWVNRLWDTGSSTSCSAGVQIPGSNGCTFVTDDRIYNENGQLIADPAGSISETVPLGECYMYTTDALRRVCGTTCSDCETNDDCRTAHSLEWGGYGAECSNYMRQLYSCQEESTSCSEYDDTPAGQICIEEDTISQCALLRQESVECCPGSNTCGTNAFCAESTWTCEPTGTVGCTSNWDCGTQVVCDRTSKTLRTPICSIGTCDYLEENIDCCYDQDCSSGWECVEYECKESVDEKTDCDKECCVGKTGYWDRACANPDEDFCCADGVCAANQDSCTGGGEFGDCMCPTECGPMDVNCQIGCGFYTYIQCPLMNLLQWLWTMIISGFAIIGILGIIFGGLYIFTQRRQ